MSDTEEVQAVEEVEVATSAPTGAISIEDALQGVLKKALIHDGLARGLRQASKALSTGSAELVILVDSITEESYTRLIEALANEPEEPIPIIKVSDAKQLGEWAGLCQIDREGNARKVVGCSCVVIKNWGEDSAERGVILEHISAQ